MNPGHEAASLAWQADRALHGGRLEEAYHLYRQALGKWSAARHPPGLILCMTNLGLVRQAQGEAQDALEYFEEALKLLRPWPDPRVEAIVRSNLGGLRLARGEHAAAAPLLLRAAELSRIQGDLQREGAARLGLATYHQDEGRLDQARAEAEEALRLAAASMADGLGAMARQNLAAILQEEGRWEEAAAQLQQACGLLEQRGERGNLASSLLALAVLELEQGLHPGSLVRARQLGVELADPWLLKQIAAVEGLWMAMQGDKEGAQVRFGMAAVDAKQHPIRAQMLALYTAQLHLPEDPARATAALPEGFCPSAGLRTAARLLIRRLPQRAEG